MKKETWRTAFSVSLALHALLFFAVVQAGGFQRVTGPEPIEVELADAPEGVPRTSDSMETAALRRTQSPLPASRRDTTRRDTKQAAPAVAAEPVPSAPSSETTAQADPEAGSGAPSASGGITSKGLPANAHSDSSNSTTSIPAGASGVSGVSGNGGASVSATNKTAGMLPYVIKGQPPAYPVDARSKGLMGKVRVKVLISEQGTVKDAFVASSSGHVSLDAAALKGLRRWLFHPAYREGRATTAWVVVPVLFRLD